MPSSSVIGITNAYYDHYFRDNYKDRVTHEIEVTKTSYSDPDELYSLSARYINAAYVTENDIRAWYQSGANPNEIPYCTYSPIEDWDSTTVNEQVYSLFPFTKSSIRNLFDRLPQEHKTPRFFLRDVIKNQLTYWANMELGQGKFPSILKSAIGQEPISISFQITNQLSKFRNTLATQEDKTRLDAIVGIWGNGTANFETNNNKEQFSGISLEFWKIIKFNTEHIKQIYSTGISPKGGENGAGHPSVGNTPYPHPEPGPDPRKKILQDNLNYLREWHDNNKPLNNSERIRNLIRDFLINTINWPVEGIPVGLLNENRLLKMIYIEGQKESSDSSKSSIIISRADAEAYQLFAALLYWDFYEDTWNFPQGEYFHTQAIIWLEKNKELFLKSYFGDYGVADASSVLRMRFLAGVLWLGICGQLSYKTTQTELLEKIFENKAYITQSDNAPYLLKKISHQMPSNLQSSNFVQNQKIIMEASNTYLGSKGSRHFFSQNLIRAYLPELSSIDFATSFSESTDMEFFKGIRKLLPIIDNLIVIEKNKNHQLIDGLEKTVGNVEDRSSWIEFSNDLAEFLYQLNVQHIPYDHIYDHLSVEFREKADSLSEYCRQGKEIQNQKNTFLNLSYYSSDPNAKLADIWEKVLKINSFVEKEEEKAKHALGKGTELPDLEDSYHQIEEYLKKINKIIEEIS